MRHILQRSNVPEMGKPVCGGAGGIQEEYSMTLHIAAVFIVLVQSTLGCGFPVVAKRVRWLKIPPSIFFVCKHFGTGVLISTAFIHLLPTAFLSLTDPCLPAWFNEIYPATPGAIVMLSLFGLFVVELWLHSKGAAHSHGGPTGVEINHTSNPHMKEHHMVKQQVSDFGDDSDIEMKGDAIEQNADPEVLKRMSLNITLLEGGILFHSIFVGMTLSVTTEGFVVFLIAILFHQTFEGLGLGSRIAAVPYPKNSLRPWILCVAFGATLPLGQVIGLLVRKSYDPSSAYALVLVGTFNAISSGLLIYAALVDILVEDFLSHEAEILSNGTKGWAFTWLLLGAIAMGVVGGFA